MTKRLALSRYFTDGDIRKLANQPQAPWGYLRDVADAASVGELECFELDVLTDSLHRAVQRLSKAGG